MEENSDKRGERKKNEGVKGQSEVTFQVKKKFKINNVYNESTELLELCTDTLQLIFLVTFLK